MALSDSMALFADDSGEETEQENPRPAKHGSRRRISEAYTPDNDASFSSDPGTTRAPLKSVNINDDAAEKRRRRKSTKIAVVEPPAAGPSNEVRNDGDATDSFRSRQRTQLNAVEAPVIHIALDIQSAKYEEWMKMATDNKINAQNSWNFALIDYFHDMSLLRNNDDNSINFQRASCTLDGCVKVWTSRVDSVGTETAKLANNLATGGAEDDDDDEAAGEGEGEETQRKRKRAHRSGTTLAKDAAQLHTKKPDLEFSIDPLFRKTCADFDEGGAHGLLMNHLSLGVGHSAGLTVVFDASDSSTRVEDVEEAVEEEDLVDISYLRENFLPDLTILEDKAISHSLEGFSFGESSGANDLPLFDSTQLGEDEDDDDHLDGTGGFDPDMHGAAGGEHDFFATNDGDNEDYGGGDMGGGGDYGGENFSNGSVGPGDGPSDPNAPFVAFDPRHSNGDRELTMAPFDEENGGLMDYFDRNIKNWAGPNHWKLRRPIKKPVDPEGQGKTTKPRQKKEAFKIDFLTPSDKSPSQWAKELFVPVKKGQSINMRGAKASKKNEEKKDHHLLPDDMHFSSRQLVSLFLKPKFTLKMRGHRSAQYNEEEGEVDANYWANAAAQAANRNADEDDSGEAIPFNTQFFHEDFDDAPGFDAFDGDGLGAGEAEEQDLLSSSAQRTRRVKPEKVTFAKRAKRVDVRKLKQNIWKNLDISSPAPKSQDDDMDVDEQQPEPTPNDGRRFAQVISGLQTSYPKDKMEEISTSFCFICLLHLANEEGLKLENNAQDEAGDPTENLVGSLWNLKVSRDPNAMQDS